MWPTLLLAVGSGATTFFDALFEYAPPNVIYVANALIEVLIGKQLLAGRDVQCHLTFAVNDWEPHHRKTRVLEVRKTSLHPNRLHRVDD